MTTEHRVTSFWHRHRTLMMITGLVVFMPPLSLLFQLTGDANFCGRWCPRMFFVWREGQSLTAFLAGWVRAGFGVALVAGILLTTLMLGRHWCSHICPAGGALELGSRLVPKRFQIDFSSVPAPSFRYAYLLVYLVAPALGLGSLCCSYCNFAAVPRAFGALFSEADLVYFLRVQGGINLLLLVLLGVLAKHGRAYCNLLCPVGAVDALVARLGTRFGRRVRIDQSLCTSCGECIPVCPTWAIEEGGQITVNQLSCMPCRECVGACPENAIEFGRPRRAGAVV